MRREIKIAGSLLGVFALTACGVSPRANGSPGGSVQAEKKSSKNSTVAPSSSIPATSSTAASSSHPIRPHDINPFNQAVQEAMAYAAARTQVPLQAPMVVPLNPSQTPRHHLYLTPSVTASTQAYQVQFQLTTTPMTLNNPHSDTGVNGAMMNIYGGFGATRYPTANQASAALQRMLNQWGQREGSNSPESGHSPTLVNLGHGIVGQSWTGRIPLVQWHEGQWTMRVSNSSSASNIATAKPIVAFLHTYLLPETHGWMGVVNAGDGDHTVLAWQEGRTVYETSNYHSAIQAMEMAVAMRNYPSGAMPAM